MAHAINNDNPPEKKFSSDERKEENKNIDSLGIFLESFWLLFSPSQKS